MKDAVEIVTKSVADIIDAYNGGREPERLALKQNAMRANAFAFFRGTAHLFWQRVQEGGVDATAPAAWCSGDLHLENFGTYLGDNKLIYFDVNDFDEAAKAPCDWEILRLLASLAIAAPALGIGKSDLKTFMQASADAYVSALATGKSHWIERRLASGAIGDLISALKSRDQARLLDRRTKKVKGRRLLDVPSARALPITEAERAKLAKFATSLGKQFGNPAYFEMLDGARRIAGTGSLGLQRYVLLIAGTGSADGNVLLDLKLAAASSLPENTRVKQPHWANEAERVVVSQRRCQAVSPQYLEAVTFDGQPFLLKELQPSADRLDLARIAKGKGGLSDVMQTMGRLSAWAQLRSSGRDGSATPDDLMAFAKGPKAQVERLLSTARALADVTLQDYTSYCQAYDAAHRQPSSARK